MAVAHFCSNCGTFSQQDGVWLHAVPCPNCGHVERCRPHTPGHEALQAARDSYAARQGAEASVDAQEAQAPPTATGTVATTSSAPAAPRKAAARRPRRAKSTS